MAGVDPQTAFRNLQEEQKRLETEYAQQHAAAAAAAGGGAASISELERKAAESRQKSSAAMRRYFNAMSGNDSYSNKRDRMVEPEPFSFEMRELTRPKRTTTMRAEQDKMKRDAETQKQLKSKFKASSVPPSTFMPKYQIMVDEWCARKEAVRLVAEKRAQELKEASKPGKEFAGKWREERRRANSRHAEQARTREEHWEKWRQQHCVQFLARPVPESTYIPNTLLEEERDASRADRVKARADFLLMESRAPNRMEESLAQRVREKAAKIAREHEIRRLEARERARREREELRRANGQFSFEPSIHRDVPHFKELWAKERLASALTKQKIRAELRAKETGSSGPLPDERDGGFKALKEHAVMGETQKMARLERAKRLFIEASGGKITPEEQLQRRLGKHDPADVDPTVATVLLEQSAEEINHRKRGMDAALFINRPASSGPSSRRSASANPALDAPCQRPRTTHAHVVKSAATFRTIVEAEQKAKSEQNEVKERVQRNREIFERLNSAGLVQRTTKIIDWDAKLDERKKEFRRSAREQRSKIDDIKTRVSSQPPLFVAEQQATYAFADLTKARADTEARIMDAWKKSGLDMHSAHAMMRTSGGAGGSSAATAASSPPAAAASSSQNQHAADDNVVSPMSLPTGSARDGGAGAAAAVEVKRANRKNADGSNKSSSDSSSSSSSSDDGFDASSSSSSSSDAR